MHTSSIIFTLMVIPETTYDITWYPNSASTKHTTHVPKYNDFIRTSYVCKAYCIGKYKKVTFKILEQSFQNMILMF